MHGPINVKLIIMFATARYRHYPEYVYVVRPLTLCFYRNSFNIILPKSNVGSSLQCYQNKLTSPRVILLPRTQLCLWRLIMR